MNKRAITTVLTAISLVVVVGACSKKAEPAPTTAAATTAAPATTSTEIPTTGSTATDMPPAMDADVTIVAREYSFDIPTISAGNHTVALDDQGAQVHMVVIVQLLDGKTVDDAMTYIQEHGTGGKPPKWAQQVAFGISAPGETTPVAAGDGGKESADPAEGIDFAAGDYVALCFIQDGMTSMDQKPPKDAKPHAELGMVQGFTVA